MGNTCAANVRAQQDCMRPCFTCATDCNPCCRGAELKPAWQRRFTPSYAFGCKRARTLVCSQILHAACLALTDEWDSIMGLRRHGRSPSCAFKSALKVLRCSQKMTEPSSFGIESTSEYRALVDRCGAAVRASLIRHRSHLDCSANARVLEYLLPLLCTSTTTRLGCFATCQV